MIEPSSYRLTCDWPGCQRVINAPRPAGPGGSPAQVEPGDLTPSGWLGFRVPVVVMDGIHPKRTAVQHLCTIHRHATMADLADIAEHCWQELTR
jgi:hypothetical protein